MTYPVSDADRKAAEQWLDHAIGGQGYFGTEKHKNTIRTLLADPWPTDLSNELVEVIWRAIFAGRDNPRTTAESIVVAIRDHVTKPKERYEVRWYVRGRGIHYDGAAQESFADEHEADRKLAELQADPTVWAATKYAGGNRAIGPAKRADIR